MKNGIKNMVIDGVFYKLGDEIWDLGSFEAISVNGMVRTYRGLAQMCLNYRFTFIQEVRHF